MPKGIEICDLFIHFINFPNHWYELGGFAGYRASIEPKNTPKAPQAPFWGIFVSTIRLLS